MTKKTSWMVALPLVACVGIGIGMAAEQSAPPQPGQAAASAAQDQTAKDQATTDQAAKDASQQAQQEAPLPPDTRKPRVAFRAECGACHIPYPPRFLPKASWRAMMANLADHFGEDASLADDTAAKIEKYLVSHAARWRVRKGATPPLRISKLRWFVHEHREEVSPRSLKKAGSWSNCAACHRGAARGYFDDD